MPSDAPQTTPELEAAKGFTRAELRGVQRLAQRIKFDLFRAWGLHYRGVAFVWIKTRADGAPIGAQGVRPSITKPLTELVLVASTHAKGRPLPLASEAVRQTIFAPRGRHSEKPEAVQDAIEAMYPTASKAELFARRQRPGWECWGNETPGVMVAA